MTKNELKQYINMSREIALLVEQIRRQEAELQKFKGLDIVLASSPEFPYILHNVQVPSQLDDQLQSSYKQTLQSLKARLKERQREMCRLEQYISNIPDSEVRQIFMLRYFDGLMWGQIARKMGAGFTGEAVRAQHNRYLGLKT